MIKKISKILFALALVAVVGLTSAGSALAYNERNIRCSDGDYFDTYGPGEWWWTHDSMGWCGGSEDWDENGREAEDYGPHSMKKTYSGCSLSNYARWNMGNIAQWSYWYAFVPSNYATSQYAPYTITYNGASSYGFTHNQNNFYNWWASLPTASNFWTIMNTWLDDDSCESSPYNQIGFDDTQVCHESSSSSSYCPGNHAP